MDWRNWKNHPFIVTILGALLLGYLVRKCTEPAPYTYSYNASPPTKYSPMPASAPTPAPVLVSPPVSTTPSQYQVAQAPSRPAPSAPVTYSAPVERLVISTPSYSSGRRGYSTYTFTLDDTAYVLDGQAAFDHLSDMKRQAHVYDPEINRLRAECASLKVQIDANRSQLNIMRAVLNRTNQSAIDGFNAQVLASNAVIDEQRMKTSELNANVDSFNAIVSAMHAYAQQHRR
jgi:hypothetical protein